MIFEAIEFAARAHAGQYRKSSPVPYIIHPISVACLLLEMGCPEPVAVAGVLHDTVEDTAVTLEELRTRFGPRVAELVAACTEPNHSATWEERKQRTLAALADAEDEALLVACADKLDNIRSIRDDLARIGDDVWRAFRRPRDSQRWYFESLAALFRERLRTDPGRRMAEALMAEVKAVFDGHEG